MARALLTKLKLVDKLRDGPDGICISQRSRIGLRSSYGIRLTSFSVSTRVL